jgi:hypothetical protein
VQINTSAGTKLCDPTVAIAALLFSFSQLHNVTTIGLLVQAELCTADLLNNINCDARLQAPGLLKRRNPVDKQHSR